MDNEDIREEFPVAEEYKPFAVMITAINDANQLRAELAQDKTVGILNKYIAAAAQKAQAAMQGLVNVDPNDPVEIMRLQKEIAAYAHVMGWIQDTLNSGNAAEIEWVEMKQAGGWLDA